MKLFKSESKGFFVNFGVIIICLGVIAGIICAASLGTVTTVERYSSYSSYSSYPRYETERDWGLTIGIFLGIAGTSIVWGMLMIAISEVLTALESICNNVANIGTSVNRQENVVNTGTSVYRQENAVNTGTSVYKQESIVSMGTNVQVQENVPNPASNNQEQGSEYKSIRAKLYNLRDAEAIENLIRQIERMDSNKESAELLELAKEKYREAVVSERETSYQDACYLMRSNNGKSIEDAIKIFESLDHYKDSKDKIGECHILLLEMKKREKIILAVIAVIFVISCIILSIITLSL